MDKKTTEMLKKAYEKYMADTPGMNSRNYKRLKNFAGEVKGRYIYFEITQWREEKANNTFDYDCAVFDKESLKIVDEWSNGEMKLGKVLLELSKAFNKPFDWLNNICYEEFMDYKIDCMDCGHCEE